MKYFIIFFLISISSLYSQTRIHSEDFETNDRFITYGNDSQTWFNLFSAASAIVNSDTIPAHGGTYSLRLNLGNTSAVDPITGQETEVNPHANIGIGATSFGNTSNFDISADINTGEKYVSFWVRYDVGVLSQLSGSQNKLVYDHYLNNQDYVIYTVRFNGDIRFFVNGDGVSGHPYTAGDGDGLRS